jgi:integrase
MTGSMRERAPGVYELRITLGRDPVTGRRRDLSRTVRGGKREAQRALAALVTEHDAGRPGTDSTVGLLFDQWLRLVARDRSPTTAGSYRRLVEHRLRPVFGAVPLRRLRADQLDAFYTALTDAGLKPRTVRNVHACLRSALAQAVRWGWVEVNVAERATPPAVRSDRRRTIDPAAVLEALRAAAAWDPDFGAVAATLAGTGARRGEVCALRWADASSTRTPRRTRSAGSP